MLIFGNAQSGHIRTMAGESGKVWFSGKVVSKRPVTGRPGRTPLTAFVDEDGLYDVILDGRKAEPLAGLVRRLPLRLRMGADTAVLEAAVAGDAIGIRHDGRLEWRLESKTLLAHFCGRMWCGDTIVYNKRKCTWRWKLGNRTFPEKELDALFGETGLGKLRRNRELCTPPCGFELVEEFFKRENTPSVR